MEEALKDKRFAHIAKDPRFWSMPKAERKVKIDSRFKEMFQDKRFKLKYSVDKRGRPVNLTTNENLKKFYELSDEDSNDSDDNEDHDNDDDKSDNDSSDADNEDEKVESDSDSDGESEAEDLESSGDESSSESDLETETAPKSNNKKTAKANTLTKAGNKPTTSDSRFQTSELANLDTKNKNKKINENADISNQDTIQPSTSKSEKKKEPKEAKKGKQVKEDNLPSVDYARGEGNISSSEDDLSDSEVDEDLDEGLGGDGDFDHHWGEEDPNIEEIQDPTSRLAVCNLDWDRLKAKDIFVVLNSFKDKNGLLKSVKIYTSEFGKECLAKEQYEGPRVLYPTGTKPDDDKPAKHKEANDSEYDMEKLRQYQLDRLRYYYAVVECDTKDTADSIYKECDGMEYETTSTKFDLRFIPEDMEFDDVPTSVCTEMPSDYDLMPSFINTALSQSKVELTWDETDRERMHVTAKQFTSKPEDIKQEDLQAYLASSSDEEGVGYGDLVDMSDNDDDTTGGVVDEDREIDKYKSLLQHLDQAEQDKQQQDVQMEITWEPGLKSTTENILKKSGTGPLTPWEEYMVKKKEKKKKKREDRKKKNRTEEEDEDNQVVEGETFSDDDLPAGVDLNDPFFADEMKQRQKSVNTDKKKKKKKNKKEMDSDDNQEEKDELSLLTMDDTKEKKHFNLNKLVDQEDKKKKKKKKKPGKKEDVTKTDDFEMNVKDPRFAAMYDSHLFNLDPSVPEFKKTKGTEAIITEKLKRSGNKRQKKLSDIDKQNEDAKRQKPNTNIVNNESLASLVQSVKSKTNALQSKKAKVRKS